MQAADVFCEAKRAGRAVAAWPGPFPETLDEAYAIQADATTAWGEPVAGLKVGRITGSFADAHGYDRFIGPIYSPSIMTVADGAAAPFPIIPGGSVALECELVAILGEGDYALAARGDREALKEIAASWHIAIEVAGSPMSGIDAMGPLASIACFGNNNGCIIGSAISPAAADHLDDVLCICRIDDVEIGRATPARLPGGVWTALAFALAEGKRRNVSLRPGFMISTGAITGMHPFAVNARAVADFGTLGLIACVGVGVDA